MGYLGFGMRKEVYTRKPKKAFKELKKLQKPYTKGGSDAGHEASKAYQEIRFKPAYKRTWFRILVVLMLIAGTYRYVDQTIFHEKRLEAARQAYEVAQIEFETQGIVNFYHDNQASFHNIASFIESREGKLASLGREWSNVFWITIRSADYIKKRANWPEQSIRYEKSNPYLQPEAIDGKLRYSLYRLQRVYEDYWSCTLELEYVQDINTTFIDHLNTNYKELGGLVDFVAKNGMYVEKSDHSTTFTFKRFGNSYTFHVTEQPDLLINADDSPPIKLANEIYWTKWLLGE